jgi:hypothetical protein
MRYKPAWMARFARLGPLAAPIMLLALSSGCQGSVAGHWRAVEVVPSKQVFCIDDAEFRRDGTYTATTTIEGKTDRETGTYSFNGFKLAFHPQAGGRRAYNAMLKLGRLEVLDGKRKVVLERGK